MSDACAWIGKGKEKRRKGTKERRTGKNKENINKSMNANDCFVSQKNISHFRFRVRCNFQHCNIAPLTNHRFS